MTNRRPFNDIPSSKPPEDEGLYKEWLGHSDAVNRMEEIATTSTPETARALAAELARRRGAMKDLEDRARTYQTNNPPDQDPENTN